MECKFCGTKMDYLESEGIEYNEQHTFACPNCLAEVIVFENLSEPMWWFNPTEIEGGTYNE